MRNFIVFFSGKEGTSPLVRLLDRFENVDVVHQVGNHGWEPFDFHTCGAMSLASLEACLDHVYGTGPIAMDALNAIYQRTATRALHPFRREKAVGFKMRFQPPSPGPSRQRESTASPRLAASSGDHGRFPKLMVDVLQRHDVTVFLAVRQDLLRWALSHYHGDGTGKPGHLQFQLAKGEVRRDDLRPIEVDCERLGRLIQKCRVIHAAYRALRRTLEQAGLRVHALYYERFLEDRHAYFREIGEVLELGWTKAEIEMAFTAGTYLEKVHSDDLSSWIINHDEVRARFGAAYKDWCGPEDVPGATS